MTWKPPSRDVVNPTTWLDTWSTHCKCNIVGRETNATVTSRAIRDASPHCMMCTKKRKLYEIRVSGIGLAITRRHNEG